MQQPLVAIFCTSHADSVGNSCRLQLLAELSKRYDLTLLTNQAEYVRSLFKEAKVKELPVYQSSLMRIPVVSKLVYAKKIAGFLNKECDGKKLFLFHDTSDLVLFLDKNIPIYTCVHQIHEFVGFSRGKGLSGLVTRINGKLLLKGVKRSKVCFANFATISDYLKQEGLKQEVIITPHFIDRSVYRIGAPTSDVSDRLHEEKKRGSFILTYTGWVSENRGLQLMMDVIKGLAAKDGRFKLCIVGCQDDYKEKISIYAKDNGIEDNVLLYGRSNYDKMPAILMSSDVCLSFLEVNPVYSVSPPQKVVEYFAAGKPVVANHIQTHEYLIEHGKNGYLLDDAASIIVHIEKLANDKQLYDELSKNALEESEKYDKEKIMDVYIKKIEE